MHLTHLPKPIVREFTKPNATKWDEPSEAYTFDLQVWYWVSNDAPVPMDVAREYGIPINVVEQQKVIDHRNREFARKYREAMAARTPEQVAEERAMARAAHGPGATLVNIITGERYTT